MSMKVKLTCGVLFAVLGACDGSGAQQSTEPGQVSSELKNTPVEECVQECDPLTEGQQIEDGNNGTGLCARVDVACVDGELTVSGSLATSGSVDSAEVTLEDGSVVKIGTIQPQDFIHDERVKFACFAFHVDLDKLYIDAEEIEKVCFTQSGAQGREPKRTCVDVEIGDCHEKPVCDVPQEW